MQAGARSPPRPDATTAAASLTTRHRPRCRLLPPPPRAAAETGTATTTAVLDLSLTKTLGKDQQQPQQLEQQQQQQRPPPAKPRAPAAAAVGSIELITGPMFSGKTTALLARTAALRAGAPGAGGGGGATGQQRDVVLVKPACDDRFGAKDTIVTHSGSTAPCVRVARLADLPRALGAERWASLDAVAVDEGQFFDDLVEFAVAASEGFCEQGRRGEVIWGWWGQEADDDGRGEKGEEEEWCAAAASGRGRAAAAAGGGERGNDNNTHNDNNVVRPKAVIVAGLSGDFRRRPFGRIAELLPLADRVAALRARCFSCGGEAPFSLRLRGGAAQVLVGGAEAYRPACRACFARHSSSSSGDDEEEEEEDGGGGGGAVAAAR